MQTAPAIKPAHRAIKKYYETRGRLHAQGVGHRRIEQSVDQYQLKTDPSTGIASDPNRPDDPEYVVRLVGQVIKVSLETIKIVDGLPKDFGGWLRNAVLCQ